MPKTEYTQDDYIRALLRSAISTTNSRLEKILNHYLEGSVILKNDGSGSVYLDTRNTYMDQVFDKTYSCINDRFFYSAQNDEVAQYIANMFSILAKGKKVADQIADYRRNEGPSVKMDLDLYGIVVSHAEKNNKELREYIESHKNSGLSFDELKAKGERSLTRLNGNDYEERLVNAGFSGRKLEQAKLFLDVLGKQYSQSRIIDFLDAYTLYHYYIFRDTINKRFTDFCDNNPRIDLRSKQIMFEKIVKEEIAKHCSKSASVGNAYFDRSKMSLASRRIDSKRAKSLSLEVMDGTPGTQRLLMAKLQSEVNKTLPESSSIEIGSLEFRPRPKREIRGLSEEERRKVLEGSKLLTSINCDIIDNGKRSKIIDNDFYISQNMQYGIGSDRAAYRTAPSESTPSKIKTQHEIEIEEERKKHAEEAKKFTSGKQLSLF